MKRIKLGRRGFIRIGSFSLALVVTLGGLIYAGWHRASILERYIEYDYQHAFIEMTDSINNIDVSLQKGIYARSPTMLASLYAQVSREAATAQSAMSSLPFAFEELEQTARFLSQVGDYTLALSKQVAAGHTPDEPAYAQLTRMSHMAGQLAAELNTWQTIFDEERPDIATMLAEAQTNLGLWEVPAMSDIESEFPETPALIYDGPFSEHIDRMKPVFLEGKETITVQEAAHVAAQFLGLDDDILDFDGEVESKIPSYSFSGRLDGGEVAIEVSRQGGYVISLINSRRTGEVLLSVEEAVKQAQEFLQKQGFDQMYASYWERFDNNVTINFAYQQGDIVCYSDLIKVGVALDTGKVVGFESRGYLMSHRQRELPPPRLSKEEAKKRVSPNLKMRAHKLALIPTDGQNEVLTHEITCEGPDRRHYLVYINTETGFEDRILILIESENGTLSM